MAGSIKCVFEVTAEQVARANAMFMELDFTIASLASLELFIDETWGCEPTPMTEARENVVRSFGSYVGETLRRIHGGRWRDDGTLDLGKLVFAPIRVVHDRSVLGSTASIGARVKAIGAHFPERTEHPDAWSRQAAFFVRIQRGDLALAVLQRVLFFAGEAKPLLKEAFAVEEKILRGNLDLMGFELDGSVASLSVIDLWFDTTYGPDPLTHEQKRSPKYLDDEQNLGAYLGNLLCARFGASWELDEHDPHASQVVWPSGFRTCPFAIPSKRADNGKGWGIQHQLETMRSTLIRRGELPPPGPEEAAEWRALAERLRARNPERRAIVQRALDRAAELDPKTP